MYLRLVFLSLVFFLFVLPASASSLPSSLLVADVSCASQATAHSAPTTTSIPLTLTNHTTVPLNLYSLSASSARVFHSTLASGAKETLSTFTGTVWLLTLSDGSCVQLFTLTGPLNVSVGQSLIAASPGPLSPTLGFPLPSWLTLPRLPNFSSQSSQPPISSTLATPLQAFSSPTHTLLNLFLAALLVLFLTFPAQLFNHTLEENWPLVRSSLVRFFHLPARLASPAPGAVRPASRPLFLLTFTFGVLFGALLSSSFGFNLPTYLALLATAVTIWFYLSSSARIARAYRALRHTDHTPQFKALPVGLLVAALCVLVSRLTDFTPGYLYGLVFTLSFASTLNKPQEGFLTALTALLNLSLALAAWLLWSSLHNLSMSGYLGFGLLLLTTVLASLFVAGLINSIFSLFPLRFTPGHKVFSWHRSVWALTFGLTLFLVFQVLLLPAQGGHATTSSLLTTLLLFVFFGAFSVAFWWYFARRKQSSSVPTLTPPTTV